MFPRETQVQSYDFPYFVYCQAVVVALSTETAASRSAFTAKNHGNHLTH
jgi:hypothetical protein